MAQVSGGWVANRRLVAVDPGDVHVGIAEFVEHDDSWECVRAYEVTHEEGADKVTSFIVGAKLDALVVERFALYADKAKQQIGSEMLTAQLIGVIKYVHRHYMGTFDQTKAVDFAAIAEGRVKTKLEFQPASIQKPTAAILRAKGVKSEAGGNAHAKSAELHGWHYILRKTN